MTGWEESPIEELIEPRSKVTYGVVKPGPEDASGVRFVRSGDVTGGRVLVHQLRTITPAVSARYARTVLRGGELLVSLVGNPGEVAVAPLELAGANIARQVGLVRLGERVSPHFAKYYLMSPQGRRRLGREVYGSVQQVINLKELKRVRMPVPPRAEQDRIVGVLSALDDKIDLNRETNRTLEAMAQAIFRSWFVDFDPVVAKSEGREPYGMDAETAALFPDRFADSELGRIPEGWDIAEVAGVAKVNPDAVGKTFPFDPIRYVDISSVSPGEMDEPKLMPAEEAPSRARRLVSDWDVIWSCVRPNRRSYALVREPPENLVVSTGFAVLRAESVPASWLYCLVTAQEFVDYLTANAHGSAYPAVRAETFGTARFVRPPKEVLGRFHDRVAPMLSLRAINQSESRTLASLRDLLLPKLLSGDISVPEVKEMVGDVA